MAPMRQRAADEDITTPSAIGWPMLQGVGRIWRMRRANGDQDRTE